MNRLDLVVGCNGAGKSTFVALTLAPLLPRSAFVNADEIAKQRWPRDPASHSYDAALVAADTRTALIDAGRSFIAETVFSHQSKLHLVEHARVAGYAIELHVVMIPEDLAIHRVASRVLAGGHSVPEIKIRERYGRLWALVARAAPQCDTATFYDNSTARGPRVVARVIGGDAVGHLDWPSWTPEALTDRWPS